MRTVEYSAAQRERFDKALAMLDLLVRELRETRDEPFRFGSIDELAQIRSAVDAALLGVFQEMLRTLIASYESTD